MIVLPVLLLFLASIFPLLSSAVVKPWLDEKLWLRHFLQGKEAIQSELENAHIKNRIPFYFEQGDLVENIGIKKLDITFPILKNSYPGQIYIQKVIADYPEEKRTTFLKSFRSGQKISRNLAMLNSSTTTNSGIPSEIRKLSVLGIFPWKMKVLKNLDSKLFHLNLDALPSSRQ
jgi:hypothetical protein